MAKEMVYDGITEIVLTSGEVITGGFMKHCSIHGEDEESYEVRIIIPLKEVRQVSGIGSFKVVEKELN